MPKRGRPDGRTGGRTATPRRRHLYLVLDDWCLGYRIRKIDLSSYSRLADRISSICTIGGQLLPPAIFCVEAPRGLPMYFVGAFGTKIMAMHPRDDTDGPDTHPLVPKRHVTAFDVRERALVFCPRPKKDQRQSYPLYIPIGNRLFALAESFQLLNLAQPNDPTGRWCARSWRKLPPPPFSSMCVASYAVHPDGRTIFVSIGRLIAPATFSFHMAENMEGGRWETLGEWMLPFDAAAHFDAKLNAWIGLSADPDTIGHICACDVIPATHNQCPATKVSKETFFSDDPAKSRHVGATLVYMGCSSRYCLVECVCLGADPSPPCHFIFRVSTFSLKYDDNGDLTAGDSRRVRCFSVPGEASALLLKYPVAFWM